MWAGVALTWGVIAGLEVDRSLVPFLSGMGKLEMLSTGTKAGVEISQLFIGNMFFFVFFLA